MLLNYNPLRCKMSSIKLVLKDIKKNIISKISEHEECISGSNLQDKLIYKSFNLFLKDLNSTIKVLEYTINIEENEDEDAEEDDDTKINYKDDLVECEIEDENYD